MVSQAMEIAIEHNSRDTAYRYPVGAVEAESRVWLSARISGLKNPTGDESKNGKVPDVKVTLRIWQEGAGEVRMPMKVVRDARSGDVWAGATIAMPESGCLMWYYFVVSVNGVTYYYGNNNERLGGLGVMSMMPPASFQITVYDRGADTPSWFRRSIMYQIFPDRFCRVGEHVPEKRGAVIHASWHDKAQYFKDEVSKHIIAYDFFGGNLAGIKSKLPYLKSLGISVIYLNPVFESESNHRYDTGDYKKIDPILGDEADMRDLVSAAREMGIRIIIDGVFSHTGANSRYFNRLGRYDSLGAYQSKESPYYKWYDFINYPNEYHSWWGFDTLPNVKETEPSYMDYIIRDEDSVLHHWLNVGIAGWRLDVIDELPAEFSKAFYGELKKTDRDAVVVGEIWEDASNKVAYGVQREYLSGREIDSAMNYPFRSAVLDFLTAKVDASELDRRMESLRENYPAHNFYAMMNLLGSHDVERVITLLGEAPSPEGMSQQGAAEYRLPAEKLKIGRARAMIAMIWQLTVPGVPSIYYGDEIGMQGFRDPHNREPYEWDGGDEEMRAKVREAARLRNEHAALSTGEYIPLVAEGDVFAYARVIRGGRDKFGDEARDEAFIVAINRSTVDTRDVRLGVGDFAVRPIEPVIATGDMKKIIPGALDIFDGAVRFKLPPLTAIVLKEQDAGARKYERMAGILLHPTSFPSPHGIGDIGIHAHKFIDFLASAGQKVWQILPLGPVPDDGSPYASPSAFAGNEMLIALEPMTQSEHHYLEPDEAAAPVEGANGDFRVIRAHKDGILRKAFERFKLNPCKKYAPFCEREKDWLDDYAFFMALHHSQKDKPWYEWPAALRDRDKEAMEAARHNLEDEINFVKFKQYIFYRQWCAVREHAQKRNVKILGDMPLFVSLDSADVWCHQELFALDENGRAAKVAGVPPDYFSPTGQLWGNPQYDWAAMRRNGYRWWIERMRMMMRRHDIVRIDHFRGLESYWEVDGKEKTAEKGTWVKGPGMELFAAIKKALGDLPIVAEDLGVMTREVVKLREDCGFPGMRVLEFDIVGNGTPRIGAAIDENSVVYTGTHDNNTAAGWFDEDIDAQTRARVLPYLGLEHSAKGAHVAVNLVEKAYASKARLAIVPMQDMLGLGSVHRMNRPGTLGGNWSFTMPLGMMTPKLATRIARMTKAHGR